MIFKLAPRSRRILSCEASASTTEGFKGRDDRRLLLVSGNCQADSTDAAAILQDFLASLGAVALTEAMGAEPACVTGLKSSL